MYYTGHGSIQTGTSVTADVPPSNAGDLLLLHVVQTGGHAAITVGAGWTLVKRLQVNLSLVEHVYYRFYQVGDTGITVTAPSGSTVSATVSGVAEVDPAMTNPNTFATYGFATGTGTAATIAAGSQPQAADRLVVFACTAGTTIGGVDDLAVNGQYQGYEGPSASGMFLAWTDLLLNADRTIYVNLDPTRSGVPTAYGAIGITLPPADRTIVPALGSQAEVYRQPPLLGTGAPLGPKADGRPVLIVQVLDPGPDDDSAVWDVNFWDDPTWAGPGRWHNVETRVRGLSWGRGATDPLAKPATGTAAITLDNLDGQASPWATIGEFVDSTPAAKPPANAPTVTSLTPSSGPTTGGTSVTIVGTHLATVTNVNVGGTSVAFTHTGGGGNKITFTTPARAAGPVFVVVTNPNGSSPTGASSTFTYLSTGAGYGLGPYGSGPYGG